MEYINCHSNQSSYLTRKKHTIYVEANVLSMYAKFQRHPPYYTPGIYAEGFMVFVFPFVRLYVRLFVRSSVTFVEFASKFCVKVSQVVYISAANYQKTFISGP